MSNERVADESFASLENLDDEYGDEDYADPQMCTALARRGPQPLDPRANVLFFF